MEIEGGLDKPRQCSYEYCWDVSFDCWEARLRIGPVTIGRYREPAPPPQHVQPVDEYLRSAPSPQSVVDLFKDQWLSASPLEGLDMKPGVAGLFSDSRLQWAIDQFGDIRGKRILEIGPLEGGHSYMLHKAGAEVIAIEANPIAFLKCLCMKEIMRMDTLRFLLGDAVRYLQTTETRFDIIVASGVLYHMTDPLGLLQAIAAKTDAMFLWTHYYDKTLLELAGAGHLFAKSMQPLRADGSAGAKYRAVRREYPETTLASKKFAGGHSRYANWMPRRDILTFLSDSGFANVSIGLEEPSHPNGPALALCAFR